MTITPTTLFRASGVAAALAGLIFVGVQINHPHLDATSITTSDVIARNLLKLCMAALALAGLTGMYLRQVTKIGLLGLLGYVLFAARLPQHFWHRIRCCVCPFHARPQCTGVRQRRHRRGQQWHRDW